MNVLKRLAASPYSMLWLGVFVFGYSWLASACIQLWIIPKMFSQPGAAEGLVVLDSIGFDRIAKAKAAEIAALGWSAWELRPEWQSPAGIASAFYAIWNPLPSSMLPFNAVVHAASACVVMAILRNFFSAIPAALGALVFILNPASFEWVAQIHRDGVFILGNLLLILGVLRFFGEIELAGERHLWYWVVLFVTPIVGTLLIWVARPYWVQVAVVTVVLAIAIWMFVLSLRRVAVGSDRLILLVMMLVSVVAFQIWLVRFHTPYEPINIPAKVSDTGDSETAAFVWQRSSWLPDAVEGRFYRIAGARQGAISQGGNTLVDADRSLNSVAAFVGYVPRAFQLGILSPFPELWGGQGSTPAMTIARKVMGGVTLVFYACLLGVMIGLTRMARNPSLWVMIGACLLGILVYAITYPNVGTLMRYRYGFYMLLIGFGTAWWCGLWLGRANRCNEA